MAVFKAIIDGFINNIAAFVIAILTSGILSSWVNASWDKKRTRQQLYRQKGEDLYAALDEFQRTAFLLHASMSGIYMAGHGSQEEVLSKFEKPKNDYKTIKPIIAMYFPMLEEEYAILLGLHDSMWHYYSDSPEMKKKTVSEKRQEHSNLLHKFEETASSLLKDVIRETKKYV